MLSPSPLTTGYSQASQSSTDSGEEQNARYHGDGHGNTPYETYRTCSDCWCVIVFMIGVAGLSFIMMSGTTGERAGRFRCPLGKNIGNVERFGHMRDIHDKFCGVGANGDYLYFCGRAHDLDLALYVCTDECPSSENATSPSECKHLGNDTMVDATGYATRPFAGLFCMPIEHRLYEKLTNALQKSHFMEYMIKFSEAAAAWQPLAVSAAIALVAAMLYLYCLEICAKPLLWLGVGVLTSVSGIFGSTLLYQAHVGGVDGIKGTGDGKTDVIIGGCLCSLSLVFGMFTVGVRHNISGAGKIVEEACQFLPQRNLDSVMFNVKAWLRASLCSASSCALPRGAKQ